jgi:arylsulfatase A-like enzyme
MTMTDSAPNILLIMADQLAAPFLPMHGHPVVKAPHIDRLAERGVVFDSTYCNFPICAPSRFSMLSGRLPHAIDAWDNVLNASGHSLSGNSDPGRRANAVDLLNSSAAPSTSGLPRSCRGALPDHSGHKIQRVLA